MKRFFTIIGCAVLTFFALCGQAQVVNNSVYRALTYSHSARMAALGGIVLPMHDGDLQTALFNPSAISQSMNNQITLSYIGDFKENTHYATAQYSHTFDRIGSFAASLQYNNYGDMLYASESGYTDGSSFMPSTYAVTLGWGRELTDKWSIGANLKYLGNQFETGRSGALGVDVAATYWSYSNWAFTLAARNIGYELYRVEMNNSEKWLPFSLDFTASKKLDHLPLTIIMGYHDIQRWSMTFDDPLDLAENYNPLTGEVEKPSKAAQFFTDLGCHLVLGGELELGKNLVLRAAYNYNTHNKMDVPKKRTLVGFSAGFGVKIKAFEIDYAISRTNIVGSPHFLTIRMDLSKF